MDTSNSPLRKLLLATKVSNANPNINGDKKRCNCRGESSKEDLLRREASPLGRGHCESDPKGLATRRDAGGIKKNKYTAEGRERMLPDLKHGSYNVANTIS